MSVRAPDPVSVPLRSSRPRILVDLGGVPALDPAEAAVLAEARAVAESHGRSFEVVNASVRARAAIEAACADLAAPVRPTLRLVPEPDDDAAWHDEVDRDALVSDNRALAERLASRFAGRGQPLDDLRQVAYIGLVLAARRFDPSRGVAFSTYAHATIAGELKRHFRDHAWTLHVARPVQELYLTVREAGERLTHQLGRTPTPAELAADLGVAEEKVVESLEVRSALAVDSLDAVHADDEAPWRQQPYDEPGYATVEERSWLVPALSALPERERRILKLRFFDGLAQSAIAQQVGISQMHVSRLLARSLRTLREAAAE